MKDFFKFIGCVVALLAALILGFWAFGVEFGSGEEMSFERYLEHGPYPEELPAGHQLVTDGEKFNTVGQNHYHPWNSASDSACEAVRWDWAMYEAMKRTERPKPPEIKRVRAWTIVTKPDTGNWCDASAK